MVFYFDLVEMIFSLSSTRPDARVLRPFVNHTPVDRQGNISSWRPQPRPACGGHPPFPLPLVTYTLTSLSPYSSSHVHAPQTLSHTLVRTHTLVVIPFIQDDVLVSILDLALFQYNGAVLPVWVTPCVFLLHVVSIPQQQTPRL